MEVARRDTITSLRPIAGLTRNPLHVVRDIAGVVLSRVDCLVFEDLKKAVEASCEERAKDRSQPVNPVVPVKVPRDNGRPERSRGVETSSSVVDTARMRRLVYEKQ